MSAILRIIIISIIVLLSTESISAQIFGNRKTPPSYQNTYLFSIRKYQRQPQPPKYMANRIEEIHNYPITEWTAADSLFYAYESVYLKKYGLALSIFSKLNIDTVQNQLAQSLYRLTLHKAGRYHLLNEYNIKNLPRDTSKFYDLIDAFTAINNAYIASKEGDFYADSSSVFKLLHQPKLETAKRSKQPHKDELVQVAFAIDSVLRQYTIMTDDRDVVLGRAFEEAGDFQKNYFYITNAFFYYSVALHYNKNDLDIASKYNQAIYDMREKNYLAISFKSDFGKIIKNRFGFSDKYIEKSKLDSTAASNFSAPKKKERKDYLPWISTPGWYIIIILFILICVLVFLRTKK